MDFHFKKLHASTPCSSAFNQVWRWGPVRKDEARSTDLGGGSWLHEPVGLDLDWVCARLLNAQISAEDLGAWWEVEVDVGIDGDYSLPMGIARGNGQG